jgi:hypothetical protein
VAVKRDLFVLCEELRLRVLEYKTIILIDLLYGCETWSFISREELRLRVFENSL